MKVVSVVGARPQFIKAFAVSRKLRECGNEILVHTGQHYDHNLSNIFFEELGISEPEYHLGIGSDTHGKQTAKMIVGIEEIIESENPDFVLLYGDTNSTLAGAISGSKASPKVIHVEAGLRSFNRSMPEEVNRILTDHASDILFAPSAQAMENLRSEGITENVFMSGDVMYDAILWARNRARRQSTIVNELHLEPGEFILATVHRAGNTDDKERLEAIFDGLADAPLPVVLPIHPRTKNLVHQYDLWDKVTNEIQVVDPVGYFDFVRLLDASERVATDSGGVQKEAFYLDTFCVTLRDETEWVETVDSGWNVLVGADPSAIESHLARELDLDKRTAAPYGDGTAAKSIVEILAAVAEGREITS